MPARDSVSVNPHYTCHRQRTRPCCGSCLRSASPSKRIGFLFETQTSYLLPTNDQLEPNRLSQQRQNTDGVPERERPPAVLLRPWSGGRSGLVGRSSFFRHSFFRRSYSPCASKAAGRGQKSFGFILAPSGGFARTCLRSPFHLNRFVGESRWRTIHQTGPTRHRSRRRSRRQFQ